MTAKAGLLNLVFLVTLLLVAYGCYRKGYSDAAKTVTAEYANDWNSDPSVNHSASYSLGYSRGRGDGTAEANQRDFMKCSEDLAQLAVESGNAKVAGKCWSKVILRPHNSKQRRLGLTLEKAVTEARALREVEGLPGCKLQKICVATYGAHCFIYANPPFRLSRFAGSPQGGLTCRCASGADL